MSRLGTILMAVALVSALLAVPLGVSAVAADEPNTSVAPGEQLAGVVGIQQAAVAGDLSERTYAARLDRAETDDERAAIVAERRAEIKRRLADHEADLAELRAAREAGNISEGTYRARVATLAAEKGGTERAAERATETARQLPADVRQARGISVESLQELRTNASELGGPETAAIAREIGGPNADRPAVGPREGDPKRGPAGPTPDRNASSQPMPASDERPMKPGERPAESGAHPVEERSAGSNGQQADGRPAESSESQATNDRSASPGGGDGTASSSDHSSHQRGDDTTRQNTGTSSGSPDPADRHSDSATGTDDPGPNSQQPADE